MFKYKLSSIKKIIIYNDQIIHQLPVETKIDKSFNSLLTELNTRKNKLDEIPNNLYYVIARVLDEYKSLRKYVKDQYDMQIVTNASLKMYEMISQMNLIKKDKKSYIVFCNAELPGGFISSINHYIKTMTKIKQFEWIASSYVSNNTLSDTYGIYRYNRNRWLIKDDMNGNLLDIDNILKIEKDVNERYPNGVDLYTSDAGIDVSDNFNGQEEMTLQLNYAQILCGLLTLSVNGNMVTKQFTIFTKFNRTLMGLLSYLFVEVYITKPLTSKPLNSEVYVICKRYKGMNSELRTYLINIFNKITPNMQLIILSENYNKQLLNILNTISIQQMNSLEKAYNLYTTYKDSVVLLNSLFDESNKLAHNKWLLDNPIKKIQKAHQIPYSMS